MQNYQRHLTLRAIGTEDFAMLGDPDSLALDQIREAEEQPSIEPTPTKRGRKRKIVEDVVRKFFWRSKKNSTLKLLVAFSI